MRIIQHFLIITLPVVILLGNFRYLIFNGYQYQKFQEKSGIYSNFQDQSEVTRQTNNLIGYYRGKNKLDHIFFSNQAIVHLQDVKNIIILSNNLLYVTLFTTMICIIIVIVKGRYKQLLQSLLLSSVATITFIVTATLGLLTIFDSLFVKLHKALFANDLWMFDASDNVIKLFPQDFFILFANTLARNSAITCFVIIAASMVFLKSQKNRKTKS